MPAVRALDPQISTKYLLATKLDLTSIVSCLCLDKHELLLVLLRGHTTGARPPSLFCATRLDQRSALYVMNASIYWSATAFLQISRRSSFLSPPSFYKPIRSVLTVLVAYNSSSARFPSTSTPALRSVPWGNQPSTKKRAPDGHLFSISNHLLTPFLIFSLEDAIVKALETHFSRNLATANSARSDFYNKFQRAADDYDRDFLKKNSGDLDTTLIFVSPCYRSCPIISSS